MNSNYKIIENNYEIAYFIYHASLSTSNLELSDQIYKKWGIRVNNGSIGRFRKNLPRQKVKKLLQNRRENIAILSSIVNLLKEELLDLEKGDIKTKLLLSREILDLIEEVDALTIEEMSYLQDRDPIQTIT